MGRLVIESKFLLLTARQASKSRDEMLEQEIATLFGKSAGRKDGGLVPQRSILPKLEFWLLLKGERVWLAVANFLMPESFVHAGHCSYKLPTRQSLYSVLHLVISI